MTASSLYNMVDSIFIGHGVGPMALAALGISFPLMNIGAAFGAAVGIGGSTLMSLRLGQRQYDKANNVLGNMVALNIITGLLCVHHLPGSHLEVLRRQRPDAASRP